MRIIIRYLAFGVFIAATSFNIDAAALDPSWWMLPAILVGWYLADMASGLVHMYMDYRPCPTGKGLDALYFYEGSRNSDDYRQRFQQAMKQLNPLERLVYDFKNHHPRPGALGRRDLWRQIGSTLIVATVPGALIVTAIILLRDPAGWLIAGLVSLQIGGTFAQYFHGTLHRERNPWAVRALRKTGLLMQPETHQLHHDTLEQDFSTNCGWSNPLLSPLFRWALRRGLLTRQGLEPTG